MTKKEKTGILKYWKDKPTEDIEQEYYRICYGRYNCDGEEMYDAGWCIEDILEAEALSKYKREEAAILEDILKSRGVVPWEELYEKM